MKQTVTLTTYWTTIRDSRGPEFPFLPDGTVGGPALQRGLRGHGHLCRGQTHDIARWGLAHTAFGGVGLGYLSGFEPLLGAAGFAVAAGSGIRLLHRKHHQETDTLVSMFWSLGMALGLLFASLKQGYTPDLMSYLFGSILFVSGRDIIFLASLDVLIVLSTVVLFRDFQAVTFDEEFSELVGLPVEGLAHYLMALISLAVVVLIQVVGVLLAIALFTSFWTSSAFNLELPSGPAIILSAALLYSLSNALLSFRR